MGRPPSRVDGLHRRVHRATPRACCAREKIAGRVVARPRHLYSIWKDTFAEGHDEPHELPRIAIIVSGAENDCYTALGAMHSTWRPVPGRFKDFIASPKNNLYRSLHTTVIGPDDRAVEVLIRTEDMHRNAEYGIAAGVPVRPARARRPQRPRPARAAASGGPATSTSPGCAAWSSGSGRRSTRCGSSSRCAATWPTVRCTSSSTGRQLLLPANATPVDVAYALGPKSGDRCVAATVNGQLAFLSSPLADGDVVEIHTAGPGRDRRPAGPSPEWLTFVRTPQPSCTSSAAAARAATTRARRRRCRSPPGSGSAGPRSAWSCAGATGLASEVPLLALAAELGYPDLERCWSRSPTTPSRPTTIADELIEQVDGGAEGGRAGRAVTAYRVSRRSLIRMSFADAEPARLASRARAAAPARLRDLLPPARPGAPPAGPAGRWRKYIVGAVALVRDAEAGPPGRLLLLRQPPGLGWSLPAGLLQRGRAHRSTAAPASWPRSPGSRLRADDLTPADAERDRAHPGPLGRHGLRGHGAGVDRATLQVDGAEVLEAAWHRLDNLPPLTSADRPAAVVLRHRPATRTTPR